METIKAMVRNGRIETEEPLELPDGTALIVMRAEGADLASKEERDPEEISQSDASWLEWYDSLQPLIFTAEEREALEADRRSRKEWELAHSEERSEKLRRLWE